MRFGQMKTCWKEDFVHLALDQLVGATPNLDREKFVKRKVATKDNKEGGDDDVRDDWTNFPLSVIDHVQHGKWNKSCMEHLHLLHEGPWLHINLKVRKSSSMTLNRSEEHTS